MTAQENPSEKTPPDLFTTAGRDELYTTWRANLIKHGQLNPEQTATPEQRRALFERWLRDLLRAGRLDPQKPLPLQAHLAEPFGLHIDQVARVIRRLRKEKLLPPKKLRMNAGVSEWTPRDLYVWEWIADQRAIRYDQLRRLLGRESELETKEKGLLSMSRTTQIIQRWVKAGLASYEPILAKQPGWIWLTRKGIQFAEEDYRASSAPAPGTISHLYWINEVRLWLEDQFDENECSWTSERWMQHQREQMKEKGQTLPHMPDGYVEIDDENGKRTFDVEVELSRKDDAFLGKLMRGAYGFSNDNLCYFVTRDAKTTVMTAFKKLRNDTCQRGWVEVYELPSFTQLGHFESE